MNNQNLITNNMKLVYFIISREYPTYLHDDDIVQSGMLGLCKAAESYDETKSKFSTYAGRCIRNEINQEFIRRKAHSKNISLETKLNEDITIGDILIGEDEMPYLDNETFYHQLSGLEKEFLTKYTMGYSPDEIANSCDCNVQKVRKVLRFIKYKWREFNGD